MRKIFYIVAAACIFASFMTSCQLKEDDLFDIDPATRQDNWMADYRRVFNNNEYGWALYTSQPTYGRHPSIATFAVKFDQEMCTFYRSSATSRIPSAALKDSVQSTYSLKMDNGIVLSLIHTTISSIIMPTSRSISHRICRRISSFVSTVIPRTRTPSSAAERPNSCRL